MLRNRVVRQTEDLELQAVIDAPTLRAMRAAVETVEVEESVGRYCVALANATRARPELSVGASPRGALALMLSSRALAVLRKRDYVVPEDVKDVGVAALGHRLTLRPETWMQRVDADDVERTVNEDADVPATVSITGATGVQTVAFVLATPDWVRPPSGDCVAAVLRADGRDRTAVVLPLSARRWGHSALGPGTVTVSACGGLLRADLTVAETRLRVLPMSARYRGTQTLPHPRGVVGLHRSVRAGEGSELIGIRRFAPGDRIRRINWRTSLRSNELHVNATATDRDAVVQALLAHVGPADQGHRRAPLATPEVALVGRELGWLRRGDLAGLHVAGVILHSDPHSEIERS